MPYTHRTTKSVEYHGHIYQEGEMVDLSSEPREEMARLEKTGMFSPVSLEAGKPFPPAPTERDDSPQAVMGRLSSLPRKAKEPKK